jgi:hypothetical protein
VQTCIGGGRKPVNLVKLCADWAGRAVYAMTRSFEGEGVGKGVGVVQVERPSKPHYHQVSPQIYINFF